MNTPTMTPGTVEMVSVEWILKNSQSSVDAVTDENGDVDYLKMAQRKGSDWQFASLVSTILTHGFRVPIVLCLNYEVWGKGTRNVVHGNGHHRMVAALLLCLDEIPVFWSDYEQTEDFMCPGTSEAGGTLDHNFNICEGLWDAESYEGPWGAFVGW